MSTEHSVEMVCTVEIEASDSAPNDWLTRVTTADFPYRRWDGPFTERDGLEHLAFNAISNGIEDASRLDGWGDLERDMVTMRVTGVETDR